MKSDATWKCSGSETLLETRMDPDFDDSAWNSAYEIGIKMMAVERGTMTESFTRMSAEFGLMRRENPLHQRMGKFIVAAEQVKIALVA